MNVLNINVTGINKSTHLLKEKKTDDKKTETNVMKLEVNAFFANSHPPPYTHTPTLTDICIQTYPHSPVHTYTKKAKQKKT